MSFSGTKGYPTKPKPGVMLNPLHPLSRGLVGYWLFNEGAGSLANDISGHDNHGALKNMAPNVQDSGWDNSKFGGGLKFDGVNDYVDCGNDANLDITDAITIEAWIKWDDLGHYHPMVMKGLSAASYSWSLRTFGTGDNLAGLTITGVGTINGTVTIDKWYHIVATYDRLYIRLYINGVAETPVAGTSSIDIVSDPLKIGGGAGTGYYHIGSINSLRIYNRALSAEEAKTLYLDPFCNLLQVPIRRYSVAAPPVGAIMNQFQTVNLGADLYNGAILA